LEGKQVKKLGFLGVFACLFFLVARIFLPFLTVIIWSAIFYAFLFPVFRWMSVKKDGTERKGAVKKVMAAVLALGGVLLIAVPAVLLGIAMAKQLSGMLRDAIVAVEKNPSILGLSPTGPIATFLSTVSGGKIEFGAVSLGEELRHFLGTQTNQILGLSG
jgi:predicted PurR-regulated permease PerM